MAWGRAIATSAWLLAAGVGCDGGGCDGGADYVLPHVADATDPECFSFDCAIALGSEVDGDAYVGTDYTELVSIASATVEPSTLADVSIAEHAFTLHALTEGMGMLHVVTTDGTTIDQPIRIAALATTTVAIVGTPAAADPLGPFDVIGAPVLVVTAIHRDATGARLLGHGFETWTATGADLSELTTTGTFDPALVRDLTLTAPAASVSAGGAPLELLNVPPHSTARLVLAEDRYVLPGAVSVAIGETAGFDVLAYSADDRFIVNPGLATARVGDPSVATSEPARYSTEVSVAAHAIGHTVVTVDLDGAEVELGVDVPR